MTGSNAATISLTNVQASQAGSYQVQVSNAAGPVTSDAAVLTVNQPLPPPQPNTLADALDNPDLQWTTGTDATWSSQTAVTHDGVDAARSGAITDSQTSTLNTTVTGPATVSFWWKVDSETNFDFLRVAVDGVAPFTGISGNVDWQQKTIALTAGAHTITWTYSKDGSMSLGQDTAWVDQVTVGPAQAPLTLTDAADTKDVVVTTTGDSPWTAQTQTTHDGVDAVQSGALVNSQSTTLEATVTGPAALSFWWKVDSEPNFDFLKVTIDGVEPFAGISGNVDWQQKTIPVVDGPHTIRWTYSKDVTVSVGQDTAWLDEVTVVPVPVPLTLADAADTTDVALTTTGDGPWTAQTQITHDGVDALQSATLANSQTSSIETTVTGPATLSFWWKVDSEVNFDFLRISVDGVEPVPGISGNVDWQQMTVPLTAGPHTIRWTYSKDGSVSLGQDKAWIDQVTIVPTVLMVELL